jgi:polyhydroxyalkanoate synthesis regulator phasin
MALFKGFSQIDLLEREPRTLCAILAEQLVLSNKAIEAQNEEIKQLREKVSKHTNKE